MSGMVGIGSSGSKRPPGAGSWGNTTGNSEHNAQQAKMDIMKAGSPEAFMKWVLAALPTLLSSYEPTRVAETDQAAMAERSGLGAVNALAGRTGMSGSGAAMMARQGVRGQRQASVNESLISMYQKAIADAYKQAGQTLGTLQSSLAGQSYPAQQGASPYMQIGQQALEGTAAWNRLYTPSQQPSGKLYDTGLSP